MHTRQLLQCNAAERITSQSGDYQLVLMNDSPPKTLMNKHSFEFKTYTCCKLPQYPECYNS